MEGSRIKSRDDHASIDLAIHSTKGTERILTRYMQVKEGAGERFVRYVGALFSLGREIRRRPITAVL